MTYFVIFFDTSLTALPLPRSSSDGRVETAVNPVIVPAPGPAHGVFPPLGVGHELVNVPYGDSLPEVVYAGVEEGAGGDLGRALRGGRPRDAVRPVEDRLLPPERLGVGFARRVFAALDARLVGAIFCCCRCCLFIGTY